MNMIQRARSEGGSALGLDFFEVDFAKFTSLEWATFAPLACILEIGNNHNTLLWS